MHLHAHLAQVVGEVLGHLLGQRRDDRSLPALHAQVDLAQEVVDLPVRRTDIDLRIDEARRPDDLLHRDGRSLELIGTGRRGDEDRLVEPILELLERQRPVVERARQAEAVLHQDVLAGLVAEEHAPGLGDRHVGLVHEHEEVRGEVVEQRPGTAPRRPPREVPGVVLDPVAGAGLAQHLEVEVRPLQEPLGLEEPAGILEELRALLELGLDVADRLVQLLPRGDEVPGGVDIDPVALREHLAGERVELRDALDLVAEELDAHREVLVRRMDLEGVAADAELAADEALVVPLVLDVDEVPEHRVAARPLALDEPDGDRSVVDGRAEAVDAGDGRDDDHIAALEEGAGRRVPHLVDLLVARGVLLDVRVTARDVRLGLVVVVVRDEVLDRVVREELFELPVELRGEGLVVGEDQGRPAGVGDDLRHRDRLARAGHALQGLPFVAPREPGGELARGPGLVAGERPREHEVVRRPAGGAIERDLEDLAGAAHLRLLVSSVPSVRF